MPTPYTPDGILALTKRLCAIPSFSERAGQENACADLIAKELEDITPAHGNSIRIDCPLCEGDPLQRRAVLALLRAGRTTAKTVLLTGHFDVVDTSCYGALKNIACDAEKLTVRISECALPPEAEKDLKTGNWLFGRGTMDMKAGLALFIAAIGELAAKKDLAVNIAFLAVPDEENNSAGMRGAIRAFTHLIETEKLNVVAALSGEPCFWEKSAATGVASRPYYTGTTGKIMPFFYAVGKPAHVGNYFSGLSASLLIAEVSTRLEANPHFTQRIGSDTLPPPACLAMGTRNSSYSVTLPARAFAYFNLLFVTLNPGEILTHLRLIAAQAAAAAVDRVKSATEAYGAPAVEPSVGVFTVGEIRSMAVRRMGSEEALNQYLAGVAAQFSPALDAREKSLQLFEAMLEQAGLNSPAIIAGFLPPYYPTVVNTNATAEERTLRTILMEEIEEARHLAGDGAVSFTEVFSGICDLSYLSNQTPPEALRALAENLPGFNTTYQLPVEELAKLHIPVANMGPAGKDAHQKTERLELDYSLRVAPKLLMQTIEKLASR